MTLRSISLAAVLLFLSACEQQGQPILRGTRLPEAPVSSQPLAPDNATPEKTDKAEKPAIKLNLTLPDIEWDEQHDMHDYRMLPDVFSDPGDDSVLNWSGRVYLDESQEARERPMMDTIKGAEVEIRVKTH